MARLTPRLFGTQPGNEVTREKFQQLRREYRIFADFVEAALPESNESRQALLKLWESFTYANLAVSVNTVPPVSSS